MSDDCDARNVNYDSSSDVNSDVWYEYDDNCVYDDVSDGHNDFYDAIGGDVLCNELLSCVSFFVSNATFFFSVNNDCVHAHLIRFYT